jgi:predicted nucleic acid-binding protein
VADLRRVYVDTCCFIDLVRVEIGKGVAPDKENDAWHVKKLLEAHRDGELEIFTSTLTIAECRHGGEGNVTDAVKSQFMRLLMSGQYVRLVQMTPFIAQDARDLTWAHGIALRGADSIHVASAIDRKCEEFLTSNGRLGRVGALNGPLQKFGLHCREGRLTECLPMKYRQQELGDGQTTH